MKTEFRLLALGDVVGPAAVEAIGERLWRFRRERNVNMVVCNAENAAVGNGLEVPSAQTLLQSGCDVLTGGNHIFRKKEIRRFLDDSEAVIRPANYPAGTAGRGYTIAEIDGYRVLVINVLGTFVHTSRLQYIEFFSRFYEDGGTPFRPMTVSEKYSAP